MNSTMKDTGKVVVPEIPLGGDLVHVGELLFEDCSGTVVLCCPVCEGDYLHQADVRVWHRGEDDKLVDFAGIVDGAPVALPKVDLPGNPSIRRQGLRIAFECERCHVNDDPAIPSWMKPPLFELTIRQHKGNTFIGWDLSHYERWQGDAK